VFLWYCSQKVLSFASEFALSLFIHIADYNLFLSIIRIVNANIIGLYRVGNGPKNN